MRPQRDICIDYCPMLAFKTLLPCTLQYNYTEYTTALHPFSITILPRFYTCWNEWSNNHPITLVCTVNELLNKK